MRFNDRERGRETINSMPNDIREKDDKRKRSDETTRKNNTNKTNQLIVYSLAGRGGNNHFPMWKHMGVNEAISILRSCTYLTSDGDDD